MTTQPDKESSQPRSITPLENAIMQAELALDQRGVIREPNDPMKNIALVSRTMLRTLLDGISEAVQEREELRAMEIERTAELQKACADLDAMREYAVNLCDAGRMLVSVLTDPRADHSHYLDEVRGLQQAIAAFEHRNLAAGAALPSQYSQSELKGTYACPHCGHDTPHTHTQSELDAIAEAKRRPDLLCEPFGGSDYCFHCGRDMCVGNNHGVNTVCPVRKSRDEIVNDEHKAP